MAKVRWFVLGSVALAVELARGVVSEVTADPPRGLNALRLARHLWELEHELHYLLDDPGRRVEAFIAREETLRRTLVAADAVFRGHEPQPAGEAATGARFPNRRAIAQCLGREREYQVHYRAASWFSHPNMQPMHNHLVRTIEGIAIGSSELARGLPGMALSLARLVLVRLLLRAYREAGHTRGFAGVDAFMKDRGIAETGVLEVGDPPAEEGTDPASTTGGAT